MQSMFPVRSISNLPVVGAILICPLVALGQESDSQQTGISDRAIALLKGVENARLAMPAGKLRIRATLKDIAGSKTETMDVQFNGWRRRFDSTLPNGIVTKTVVTEADLIHFDGEYSCTLRQPHNALVAYCFDPRALGIMASYLLEDSVDNCVAYRGAKSVSLVGTEMVNGHRTWHVRVVDRYGQHVDFWIEDARGFPVHKYQFRTPSGGYRAVSVSRYNPDKMNEPIPVHVESAGYDERDQMIEQRIVTVLEADSGIEVDTEVWELAGLGLPVGTPVSDLRLKQRIGYWDGRGLSKNVPPVPFTSESTWRFWPVAGIGLLLLVMAVLSGRHWWRRADTSL